MKRMIRRLRKLELRARPHVNQCRAGVYGRIRLPAGEEVTGSLVFRLGGRSGRIRRNELAIETVR